jgi:uncharacterized protein (TIGR03435 family)
MPDAVPVLSIEEHMSTVTVVEKPMKRRAAFEAATRSNKGQLGGQATASEPDGILSLFEAIERQLGLKLQEQKHTMPVLVIDHLESKPLDN